jgi:hypothetical protein
VKVQDQLPQHAAGLQFTRHLYRRPMAANVVFASFLSDSCPSFKRQPEILQVLSMGQQFGFCVVSDEALLCARAACRTAD